MRSRFSARLMAGALLVASFVFGTAPSAQAARGRPVVGATKTFVSDTGTLLRGGWVSTEVGTLPTRATVDAIKNYGCNAVHLYAERGDYGYTAGSKAASVDQLVQWTREDGLYLIITIGNGGLGNTAFINAFWNFYAGRYANETHVIYEIQNEAVNSPGVSSTAITAELNAYNIIRSKAPNTPVLFFTYIAFSGGANVIADINALGSTVDWTKAGIAFHGYGSGAPQATLTCLQYVQAAGYPCVQTEFYVWPWGTGNFTLGQGSSIYQDTDETAGFERLGCSWMSFLSVSGIADDTRFKNRVLNAGIRWVPDFGTWPGGSRGTYGNSGQPWTQSSLSSTLHIEAENYDTGGEGVAYHDNSTSNQGGAYRTTEGVDVQTTTDTGGGYNIGYFEAGEWMEYTTFITNAGQYTLKLRVAATATSNSLNVALSGVDLTGTWTFAGTGGYQTWTTISKTVFLTPGQQTLRVTAGTTGVNLNWIELTPAATGAVADGTYKFIVRHTGMSMDVVDASTANFAKIQQWGYAGNANQKWTITHLGANEYKILSYQTGKSIDEASYTKLSGDYIQMYNSASSGNQRWILTPTDSGYYSIISANSGLVLEIVGAGTTSGTLVDQSENTQATNQQWSPQAP